MTDQNSEKKRRRKRKRNRVDCQRYEKRSDSTRSLLCPLPSARIQLAKDNKLFVFALSVALKKRIFLKIHILSCFVKLKSFLLNLLCVFNQKSSNSSLLPSCMYYNKPITEDHISNNTSNTGFWRQFPLQCVQSTPCSSIRALLHSLPHPVSLPWLLSKEKQLIVLIALLFVGPASNFWLVGTVKCLWTSSRFPNYISSLRASCNRRRASRTLCSWRWMSSSETSICWMWGWLASMLTPGFFWMDDRLLLCPVTGTVFRWRAAEMLWSTLSVASSGPTPVWTKKTGVKRRWWGQ